jgi:putative Mn2+ efflux pump MntP
MDAFAVALAAGVLLHPASGRQLFRLGFHFGLFQALMPIIGWLAGSSVQNWLEAYDHWIAFGLLVFVGGKMIREAFHDEDERRSSDPTRGFTLVMLSVATSIDALAVGLTLGMLAIDIWFPALIIGLVAGGMTLIGMRLGGRIGSAWGQRVEILGGLVLILIGVKILMEHTLMG